MMRLLRIWDKDFRSILFQTPGDGRANGMTDPPLALVTMATS